MDHPLLRPLPGRDYMLSITRIVVGLCYLQHGMQKHFQFPPTTARPPEFLSLYWFAGTIEMTCGILLVLGLLARPAAFIAAGEVACAFWIAHWPRGIYPAVNGGTLVVVYCFTFLLLFFMGPGPISLDRLIFGRKDGMDAQPAAAE
ncbi:DoxX family protein [Falsiroseomonas sp. HW251]|uniref:DoxX family protein n=1 Tax=Falsiroseomonas sp. HW251 TaxID=3390998 RepID=UPI003D31A14F